MRCARGLRAALLSTKNYLANGVLIDLNASLILDLPQSVMLGLGYTHVATVDWILVLSIAVDRELTGE